MNSFGQGENIVPLSLGLPGIPGNPAIRPERACEEGNMLAPANLVHRRNPVGICFEFPFPKHLSTVLVVGANETVRRCPHEYQPSSGDDRSVPGRAVTARVLDSPGGQRGDGTQGNSPLDRALAEIVGHQLGPRRTDYGKAVIGMHEVSELPIVAGLTGRRRWSRAPVAPWKRGARRWIVKIKGEFVQVS